MDKEKNINIAFTICTNNYLAQAKALGDSLLKHNPDYHFIIGLVDKKHPSIDYSYFEPFEIIPIEQIEIEKFDEMNQKYNIFELNTSAKPFYFDYLLNKYSNVNIFVYFDSDIYIYNSFDIINENLTNYDILLTPHFFTPIYDKLALGETQILNCGLYNLGFIGLKRTSNSLEFLNWWKIKLTDQCFVDFQNGLFGDQLWINLAPIYFDNVLILKNKGLNVAYWNLHKRQLSYNENMYWINEHEKLVFFHFSGYNFKYDENAYISKYQNRYRFNERVDVQTLFIDYDEIVKKNNYDNFILIKCFYDKMENENKQNTNFETKLNFFKKFFKRFK